MAMDSLIPKSNLSHRPQSRTFSPPPLTVFLSKLPLENMEALVVDRLSWFAGFDIEKHVFTSSQF
jgi:hypothetical protein